MADDRDRETLTYSSIRAFRNCRKMYDLRYNQHLAPIDEDSEAQALGTIFHGSMERWHRRDMAIPVGQAINAILEYIDGACPDRITDDRQKKIWHLARAMFLGYIKKYPSDAFDVVAVEKAFESEIVNPETDHSSRTFIMRGKVDGIIVKDGKHYLLEHKSAATIDGNYIDRLPMDFQIILYSDYIERFMNIRIAGILYNVVGKAQIKQGKGETVEEFQKRRAELIAKSKTGKTSAKQWVPESDEEFQERLAKKYSENDMFHREMLIISRENFDVLHSEIWELTQQLLLARRTGQWYMNTDYCFHYNRPCMYFPICRSGGNPLVIENRYRIVPPHSELDGAGDNLEPMFT
ncbi:MAG: PD-(D/E)XK nuclease superfamily protein [bacterium ADurb.Bin236]|nr:MAG: PD-(D/E)XK nuclease superfamily protein [bacterium ADurb.Bin236]